MTPVFIIFAFVPMAFCQLQQAVLYDKYDGLGDYMLIKEEYIDSLHEFKFDDKVQSVCVTGMWIFYEDDLFNYHGEGDVEYYYGRDNYCVNLRILFRRIASVKFVGDPKNPKADTFTVYQYHNFQGPEEYTEDEMVDTGLFSSNQSIIVTGDSDWTIYDQPNYQGAGICLTVADPGSGGPSFIPNLQTYDPTIPSNYVRSMRKGCETDGIKMKVPMLSFERMQSPFAPRQIPESTD